MEPRRTDVVLILADISGYTRFMVTNRKALLHSQVIISELIRSIIRQVEIPLRIAKLEGDAVFLYAERTGDAAQWAAMSESIGQKLIDFFRAFSAKIVELRESNTCACNACQHVDDLKLKLVVHSGEALVYTIDRFEELSGVDVILAHRLLKNSVASNEYILMTEAARRAIEFVHSGEMVESQEIYDDIGPITIWVYVPPRELAFRMDAPLLQGYSAPRTKVKTTVRKAMGELLLRFGLTRQRSYKHLPAAHAGPSP